MPITETAAIGHFVNVNFVILGRATGRVQIAGNAIIAMPVNPADTPTMRLTFDIRLIHTKQAVRYVAKASLEQPPLFKEKRQCEGSKQRAAESSDSSGTLRRMQMHDCYIE